MIPIKPHLIGSMTAIALMFSSGLAIANEHSNFAGPYVGASIGALGISGTQKDTHTVPAHVDSFSGGTDWGLMAGAVAGIDFLLLQSFIIGGFVEVDFSNAEFDLTAPDGDRNMLQAGTIFNAGARLGVLVGNDTLLYGNGGYSSGRFKYTYASGASDEYTNSRTFAGWFLGAGLEQQISGPWSAKIEYRYTHYNDEQVGFTPVAVVPPMDEVTRDIDADTHSIRLGLNFNFNTPQ